MRILAVQLKRIGDLVLTTPALAALRKALPEAHITLLAADDGAGLLGGMPFVDAHKIFKRAGSNPGMWAWMFRSHFDVCLDFTGTDRSALVSALSTAKKRATFSSIRKSSVRSWFYNETVDSAVRDFHTIDHYAHLLRAMQLDVAPSATPVLEIPEWADREAAALLAAEGVSENFVVLHPGSARLEKCWPAERWFTVAEHCRKTWGYDVVLTGGRDPAEQEELRKVQAAGAAAVDLSGRCGLLAFAALLRRSRLVVSVDSAAMHLAASGQVPQVALFGPTNPFHWRPRHARAVVVTASTDAVALDFQPKAFGALMDQLSTPTILAAMEEATKAE